MRVKPGNHARTDSGWLLFFYSVPSKPVSNRMKVWRRLAKAGAVQLKGSVYILPGNDEHRELFQWLVSEVEEMKGEAAFVSAERIDSMPDVEIIGLFHGHKDEEYLALKKPVEDIETRVNSIRKGSGAQGLKALSAHVAKVSRNFEEIRKTDFFSSKAGSVLRSRIGALHTSVRRLAGPVEEAKPVSVTPRRPDEYQGKVWLTRERPFVDRMASAWLIRRFIDRDAVFRLGKEKDLAVPADGRIRFDVSGGEFTHIGDLCTFEVLMKAFGLKDKAVRKIAEIVHELDIRDGKYRNPESSGLEEILNGLRKGVSDDRELLEKGMAVFEMLYASKAG